MQRIITAGSLLGAALLLTGCTIAGAATGPAIDARLQTAAERTNAFDTTNYHEVVRLCDAIAAGSPLAHRTALGDSYEGRSMPMLVIADPPVTTPDQARASGKLVIYAFGGIHSGEACGKEALLALARDITLDPSRPDHRAMLDHLVLLVVPLYNPDGEVRRSPGNRPGQIGPAGGMGQRANAQEFDLNRDHVKLESPEARAQVALLNTWDPHVIIDTHTTNGSYHRMDLTYAPPLNPSGDPALLSYAQDTFMPEVEARVRARHGLQTAPYGNFDPKKTVWATYSANPMFGGPYRGLRNRISILTEAYAYATFAERIRSTDLFVRECLLLAAEHREAIIELQTAADASNAPEQIGIRHEYAKPTRKRVIPGWLETLGDSDRMIPTGAHREYTVDLLDRFAPTQSVTRPAAYLIPPGMDAIVDQLRLHGIRTERIERQTTVVADIHVITSIERSDREFQGHAMTTVETERIAPAGREIGPGWTRVPTDQPLGTLLVYLMEPESAGGLALWNFFDPWIEAGEEWPVLRENP